MTCPWWVGWWHTRQRTTDLEVMWRSLRERAETPDDARVAWDVFLSQPGQAHWHCACGRPIAELFRTVQITIEA